MLRLRLLYLFGAVAIATTDVSTNCYDCASPELKDKWHLTMLPLYPDQKFLECRTPNNKTSCNSLCVSYLIEDPSATNDTNKILFVRGCFKKFAQNVLLSNQQSYCEMDEKLKQTNGQGDLVDAKYKMIVCQNTDNKPCNSDYDATSTDCNRPSDSAVSNFVPECYECNSKNKDCKSNSCSKKYCVKKMIKVGSYYATQKYCSDVNPYGGGDVCNSIDFKQYPFGVHNDVCFCKDKQYCNSAPSAYITCTIFFAVALAFTI